MHVCSTLWTGVARRRPRHDRRAARRARALPRAAFRAHRARTARSTRSPSPRAAPPRPARRRSARCARKVDGGWRDQRQEDLRLAVGRGGLLRRAVHRGRSRGRSHARHALHRGAGATRRASTIVGDWDPLGMRGTVSRTLVFKDVFVPDDAQLMPRGRVLPGGAPLAAHVHDAVADLHGHRAGGLRLHGAVPARRGAGHAAGQAPHVPDQADRGGRDARQAGADARAVPAHAREARVDPTKDARLRAYAAQYTIMENANDAVPAGDPHLRRPVDAEVAAARAPLPRLALRLADAAVDRRAVPRPPRPRGAVRAGRDATSERASRRLRRALGRGARRRRRALRLRRAATSATRELVAPRRRAPRRCAARRSSAATASPGSATTTREHAGAAVRAARGSARSACRSTGAWRRPSTRRSSTTAAPRWLVLRRRVRGARRRRCGAAARQRSIGAGGHAGARAVARTTTCCWSTPPARPASRRARCSRSARWLERRQLRSHAHDLDRGRPRADRAAAVPRRRPEHPDPARAARRRAR